MTPRAMECIKQLYDLFVVPLKDIIFTLIGAGIGAHIAFKYQQHSDKLKEREEQITALKIAQGSIHSHWSSLDEIHRFLAANRSDISKRLVNLQDLIRVRSILPLDIPSVAFLFNGKHANLIQEIMLVEGASLTAISAMKQRTELIKRLHDDSANTRSVKPDSKSYTGDMDAVTCTIYIDLCESMESSTKESCEDAKKAFYALKAAGEEIFGGKFLDLEDLPSQKP
jgi:hypothetical protein